MMNKWRNRREENQRERRQRQANSKDRPRREGRFSRRNNNRNKITSSLHNTTKNTNTPRTAKPLTSTNLATLSIETPVNILRTVSEPVPSTSTPVLPSRRPGCIKHNLDEKRPWRQDDYNEGEWKQFQKEIEKDKEPINDDTPIFMEDSDDIDIALQAIQTFEAAGGSTRFARSRYHKHKMDDDEEEEEEDYDDDLEEDERETESLPEFQTGTLFSLDLEAENNEPIEVSLSGYNKHSRKLECKVHSIDEESSSDIDDEKEEEVERHDSSLERDEKSNVSEALLDTENGKVTLKLTPDAETENITTDKALSVEDIKSTKEAKVDVEHEKAMLDLPHKKSLSDSTLDTEDRNNVSVETPEIESEKNTDSDEPDAEGERKSSSSSAHDSIDESSDESRNEEEILDRRTLISYVDDVFLYDVDPVDEVSVTESSLYNIDDMVNSIRPVAKITPTPPKKKKKFLSSPISLHSPISLKSLRKTFKVRSFSFRNKKKKSKSKKSL